MQPITSQPGQSPPPSYDNAVKSPPFNPEVITAQPIPTAPELNGIKPTEEVVASAPIEAMIGNIAGNPPNPEEEERRRRRREECCCDPDPYPDYTGDDLACWICCIRAFCNPCRLFCWGLGECTNDCCECCANCLHNCCEPNTSNHNGCCGDDCCGDQDCDCCGDDCWAGGNGNSGDCCGDGGDCCGDGGCDCDCSD